MKVTRQVEKTARAWLWRSLLGPAMLVDGLLATLTVGTLSAGAGLSVSRRLAMARFVVTKDRNQAGQDGSGRRKVRGSGSWPDGHEVEDGQH